MQKLTKYAQAIKAELAMSLDKLGYSLPEFDQLLKNLDTGEGVLKVAAAEAGVMNDMMRTGFGTAASLPDLALKLSLAGGAAAGLTMDEMDSSVVHLNKSLQAEREKVQLVRRLTENLRKEHGLE